MTSSSQSFGLVTWDNLPDPRANDASAGESTAICVTKKSWRHIVQEHITANSEPWESWLSAKLIDKLSAFAKGKTRGVQSRSALLDASKQMEREVRESLAVPLALLYQRRRRHEPNNTQVPVWEILLASGIVAIVHETRDGNLLWTAYFPSPITSDMDSLDRWRESVRYQVDKYTERRQAANSWNYKEYVPTNRPIKKRGRDEETCHQICWVTLASWGFREDRRFGMRWAGMPAVSVPPSLATASQADSESKIKLDPPPASKLVRGDEVRDECRSTT